MDSRRVSQSVPKKMYVVGLLALAIIAATASAQTAAPAGGATRAPVHEIPRSQRGEMYYARRYGVDHLQVRSTSSGQSLEFRYRVLDPSKAARLNDKKAS
ncbi:MAG TPA: hypothetical protein VJ454_16515, partial [Steroidobacteraceae bacterium]|nr:hypothetical protein [Steroidobacteraceae bacterium]